MYGQKCIPSAVSGAALWYVAISTRSSRSPARNELYNFPFWPQFDFGGAAADFRLNPAALSNLHDALHSLTLHLIPSSTVSSTSNHHFHCQKMSRQVCRHLTIQPNLPLTPRFIANLSTLLPSLEPLACRSPATSRATLPASTPAAYSSCTRRRQRRIARSQCGVPALGQCLAKAPPAIQLHDAPNQ